MKKLQLVLIVLLLSSCGQVQRIMDGTETLPGKLDSTNDQMKDMSKKLDGTNDQMKGMSNKLDSTNDQMKGMSKSTAAVEEGVRKQKQSEALKMLKDPATRANLVPIPLDMLAPARTLAESLTVDETLLFFKNYLIKITKEQAADTFPVQDEETFQHNRISDFYMLELIAGFLPDETVAGLIKAESNQGPYQEIMFGILKLRADFNSDMMLVMGVLGLNPNEMDEHGDYKVLDPNSKLNTLGKIQKAMEYNEKVDMICNLDFADKIDLQIDGFGLKPLDKNKAKNNWKLIMKRAESDFSPQSLSRDPAQNEKETQANTAQYNKLMDELKQKAQ